MIQHNRRKKMQIDLYPETLCFCQILFSQYTVFISKRFDQNFLESYMTIYDTAEGVCSCCVRLVLFGYVQTKQDVHILDALLSDFLRKYSLYYKF